MLRRYAIELVLDPDLILCYLSDRRLLCRRVREDDGRLWRDVRHYFNDVVLAREEETCQVADLADWNTLKKPFELQAFLEGKWATRSGPFNSQKNGCGKF